ncbi:MAG: UDP-N-acetylmuramoyl-tripeptide--D-alanyl-D-alanine ligase [Candidatus Omnitrophica bacterium]|nr:UDP-N-acetylmuramoyl-tripeptide--D-alanyl-D-alanine ligase [Candidatus Omnitrophota bacterium]
MPTWTVGQLLEATGGELISRPHADPEADRSIPVEGVSLDSRRLRPGEAFLAIRGPRFDAHRFIPDVIDRGAACLVVCDAPPSPPPIPTILVSETAQALGAIAAAYRRRFRIPVIAVTGSCGKTTTKELIAHLLSQDHRVLKTNGTENNHIGLPLTLLRLDASHDVAVVELGSNHPGEIASLARIARPTVAVITNVGPAHLEFFGSLEAVRQEKLSLLEALEPAGSAVLPGDQLEVLLGAKQRLPPGITLLTFGTSQQCGVQACGLSRQDGVLSMRLRDAPGTFCVPLLGSHNVENTLAALACLRVLGVPLDPVRERLARFSPLPLRSQLLRVNGLTILNDCYNANPLSFARALEVLRDLEVKRRVVIAGDMLELGAISPAAHEAIGRLCAQLGIDVVVAVGTFAEEVARGASETTHTRTVICRTVEELQALAPSLVQNGDGWLIKGSRKLQLERVTEHLVHCVSAHAHVA